MTDFHSFGRRPAHRIRTPRASSWSRRRWMTSRLKPMSQRTSSGERFQFSVENAYAERYGIPISMAPSMTSKRANSPLACPSVRLRPRCLAHRPLPSMTMATWRGMSPAGSLGGRAPEGWGVGPCLAGREVDGMEPAYLAKVGVNCSEARGRSRQARGRFRHGADSGTGQIQARGADWLGPEPHDHRGSCVAVWLGRCR